MMRSLRIAAVFTLLMTLLLGIIYPLVVTTLSQLLFRHAASGSLVERDGKVIGSELLAQEFTRPIYFWSRPAAVTPANGVILSGGSNLAPSNPKLIQDIGARLENLRPMHSLAKNVPADMLMTSASGLDPHISPDAARWQIPRVARARGMSEKDLQALVEEHVEGRQLGVLGEPRVNVLKLNLALDRMRHDQR